MPFTPDELILQDTGELDLLAIRQRADLLSRRDYGSDNYPPSCFRSHELNVTDLARVVRAKWRETHGLTDDTPYTTVTVPAWGCSGDSFARAPVDDGDDGLDSEGYPLGQPREWLDDELVELRRRNYATDDYGRDI